VRVDQSEVLRWGDVVEHQDEWFPPGPQDGGDVGFPDGGVVHEDIARLAAPGGQLPQREHVAGQL
jgi:hypothetical protein